MKLNLHIPTGQHLFYHQALMALFNSDTHQKIFYQTLANTLNNHQFKNSFWFSPFLPIYSIDNRKKTLNYFIKTYFKHYTWASSKIPQQPLLYQTSLYQQSLYLQTFIQPPPLLAIVFRSIVLLSKIPSLAPAFRAPSTGLLPGQI